MYDFFLYLIALATVQNIVLSTGIGASVMLRMSRQPKAIPLYCGLLCGFSVVDMLLVYPIRRYLLPNEFITNLLSPAIVVLIVIFVYLLVVTFLKRLVPRVLSRIQRILSLAAFNNVLIGVLMFTEFSFNTSLWGALGAAIGAALGFFLLSRLVEESLRRLDNPEMPTAFKGFPIALLYLGLLALAFSGFKPAITLF